MVQNSRLKEDLMIQAKEAYGKIVYTYTCHNKVVDQLQKNEKWLKWIQIVLSAVSTGGILGSVIKNDIFYSVVAASCSTGLLIINLFFKTFSLSEEIDLHRNSANNLWLLKEKYVSFMTDFESLSIDEVKIQRDSLQQEASEIYSNSPKTTRKSYKEAQNVLKNEEEQFFSVEELNKMLPIHLRNND